MSVLMKMGQREMWTWSGLANRQYARRYHMMLVAGQVAWMDKSDRRALFDGVLDMMNRDIYNRPRTVQEQEAIWAANRDFVMASL